MTKSVCNNSSHTSLMCFNSHWLDVDTLGFLNLFYLFNVIRPLVWCKMPKVNMRFLLLFFLTVTDSTWSLCVWGDGATRWQRHSYVKALFLWLANKTDELAINWNHSRRLRFRCVCSRCWHVQLWHWNEMICCLKKKKKLVYTVELVWRGENVFFFVCVKNNVSGVNVPTSDSF